MDIYLPIAGMPVNVLMMIAVGGVVGFVSGLFGVGGGFLLTPLLIFSGIPHAVAVATVTPQVVASSTSGALSYWRRKAIDFKLSAVLFVTGAAGTVTGAWVFGILDRAGQIDIVVSFAYMGLLGFIGITMLIESVRAMRRSARAGGAAPPPPRRRGEQRSLAQRLPFRMRFRKARLYVSVIPIVMIGFGVGFIGTLLGIGGGFLLVPAMIYLLGVPTSIVIGTSLVQILTTMSVGTVSLAITTGSVDGVLAFLLMIGGVIGAQFGASVGLRLRGDHLRFLLAVLVLAVGARFAVALTFPPADPFSLAVLEAMRP